MVRETARNDSVSVGTTAVQLLKPANLSEPRQFFAIRNTSTGTQKITLVFGDAQAITDGAGIVLSPNDSFFESSGIGFEVWQHNVWALSDAANGSVAVVER